MRRPALLIAVAGLSALGGCGEEPDFDARYAAHEAELRKSAARMERDIAGRIAASRDAAAAMAAADGPAAEVNEPAESAR